MDTGAGVQAGLLRLLVQRKFQNLDHPKNHEYDGEINETLDNYFSGTANACGQVCPVEAIPPLSLEEKREQIIGLAYIDQNRCIPWADNQDCIVCEEMCPVPDKAIRLEPVEVKSANGEMVSVQRPQVIRELCIGCGICEYKCPLDGEAAICIYVPPAGV